MPDDSRCLNSLVVSVVAQAAAVSMAPEDQVRAPSALFEVHRGGMLSRPICVCHIGAVAATPLAARQVCLPEAQAVGPASPHGKPAVEDCQVVASNAPTQRWSQS